MLYLKLAWGNTRRHIKEYSVYFLALVIFISMMYGMGAITGNSDMVEEFPEVEKLFEILRGFSILIAGIFALVIMFINKYIRGFRRKEVGVYLTLGFSRGMITFLIMFENLVLMAGALIIGTFLGFGISELLTCLCTKIFAAGYIFQFGISKAGIYLVGKFILAVYCITAFMNINLFVDEDVYDLLKGERKIQKIIVPKVVSRIDFGILSIVLLLGSYLSLFWFIFVQMKDKILLASVILFVVGTYVFYYRVSSLMIRWKEKNSCRYYSGINLFTFGQFMSKISDNSFFMATSSLLLTMAILFATIGLDAASSMRINREKEEKLIYDILVSYDINSYDFSDMISKMKESGMAVEKNEEIKIYAGHSREAYFMGISDYNRLMSMGGMNALRIDKGEVILHSNYFSVRGKDVKNDLAETITIEDEVFTLKESPYMDLSIDDWYIPNLFLDKDHLFIVGDEMLVELNVRSSVLLMNTDSTQDHFKNGVFFSILKTGAPYDKNSNRFIWNRFNLKRLEVQGWRTQEGQVLIIGFYMSIIVLVCVMTFLAMHILSDMNRYKKNVKVLKKLGAGDDEIRKSLKTQMAMYFGFPMVIAVTTNLVVDVFLLIAYMLGSDWPRSWAIIGNVFMAGIIIYGIYMLYLWLCYSRVKKNY